MSVGRIPNNNKLTALFGLVFFLALAHPAANAQTAPVPCVILPPALRTPSIIHKAGQVSQILDELSVERQRFLQTGAPADIFSMLYYHTTVSEFRNAMHLDPDAAEADLDLILAFYDSYRTNRQRFDQGRSVELHWRSYYRSASDFAKQRSPGMLDLPFLILDGIDAHINDLARVLRYAFPRLRITLDRLRKLYFDMDDLFAMIPGAVDLDIEKALPSMGQFAALDRRFHLGVPYVIQARHRAWEAAVSTHKLVARGKQPILDHDDKSRTFFSPNDDARCTALEAPSRVP